MALTVGELIAELVKYDFNSEIELEVNVDYQCGEYKYAVGIAMSVGADKDGKNVYITTEE